MANLGQKKRLLLWEQSVGVVCLTLNMIFHFEVNKVAAAVATLTFGVQNFVNLRKIIRKDATHVSLFFQNENLSC